MDIAFRDSALEGSAPARPLAHVLGARGTFKLVLARKPDEATPMIQSLKRLVEKFAGRSILVVGDCIVDEYLWGAVERISPEAPVPVVEFRHHTHVLGGAANVAANIVSLGAHAYLGGVVGSDPKSDLFRNELTRAGIDARLVSSQDRPTTIKTRIMGGSQQMLRVDHEQRGPINDAEEDALLNWSREHIRGADAMLISDYAKGVVTFRLAQGLINLARDFTKPIVVDPKGNDFSRYKGATTITPNTKELRVGTMRSADQDSEPSDVAQRLISALEGTSIVLTQGPDGVSVFQSGKNEVHVPASVRQVFDVTGAGDTFVATLTLALAVEADLKEAAHIANTAAGIVVEKLGTATVSLQDLLGEL